MRENDVTELDLTPSETTVSEWKDELIEDHHELAAWFESDARNNPEQNL